MLINTHEGNSIVDLDEFFLAWSSRSISVDISPGFHPTEHICVLPWQYAPPPFVLK